MRRMMNAEIFASLSDREKEVLRLLAGGHEAKSVAQTLGLSVHTVNEYLRTARRKLDAPNSRSAARQLAAFEEANPQKITTPEFFGDEKSGDADAGAEGQKLVSTGRRRVRNGLLIGGILAMLMVAAAVFAVLTGAVTVGTSSPMPVAQEASAVPAEATSVAADWLKLLDDRAWAASHQAMGKMVTASSTDAQWEGTVAPVRDGLGAFSSREVFEATRTNMLPGAPEGDYVMQQFKTRFANHPDAVETVIMVKEAAGWKVIGDFVR